MRAARLFPLVAVPLLLFHAQGGRAQSPWKEVPQKLVLSTGLKCLYQQDAASPTTVVQIFVSGGRGAVPAGADGLAYLATSLSLEIPDEGKVRDLMSQATRMSLSVWEDCSVIHIECLSGYLEPALRVASGIVQNPLLTGARIDRTKKQMLLRGRALQNDAEAAGRDAILRAVFGDRGYGAAAFGTEDSLKPLGRKEISSFRRQYFTASGLFFSVVSDLELEGVRFLLEKYFANFPPGGASDHPLLLPALPEDRNIVSSRETKQTYIGRAFLLPAPDPLVYAQALVLEAAIGRGPGSRLWGLRASGQLAYNVNARTTWTRSAGVLETYLETEVAKSKSASAALDAVLSTLHGDGLSEEEFEASRLMAAAQFLRSIETKSARARAAGTFEIIGLGHDYLSGVFDSLGSVTLAEMNTLVKDVLGHEKALRVTIGPGPPGDIRE